MERSDGESACARVVGARCAHPQYRWQEGEGWRPRAGRLCGDRSNEEGRQGVAKPAAPRGVMHVVSGAGEGELGMELEAQPHVTYLRAWQKTVR